MISFYSGTPGSGKSLHTARDIYFQLFRKKKNIISNFDINMDIYNSKNKKGIFKYVPNYELTPEYLIEFARKHHTSQKEGQTILVIDECQLMFNSRTWQQQGRSQWIEFFTQHRKFFYDVILISQFDRLIDRQIRSLIEYEVVHRKVNNFKIGDYLPITLFVAVTRWYSQKAKIGSQFFIYREKYSKMYDSYKTFKEQV
ncbi:hypothetical protein VN21_00360 [Paraclostridium benzoelyticum]|uniref:Zona occludens toxin N-terminal domain-containing protein n=1 Tax=Paraclostridium benzoelyticum TaxID=1629550 RepID=A0A0M3DNE4_9FIRM|nr:zonular occludens toxin domain-containing protein [Paraclostridium benzoelyticum]KKY02969.1 hypothetical protein VN21_00360 [Paraclostridium benzoelyticum]